MRYYKVTCLCGHCGRGKTVELSFVEKATNVIEAQDKARRRPRVKHSKMVCYAHEITRQEYDDWFMNGGSYHQKTR